MSSEASDSERTEPGLVFHGCTLPRKAYTLRFDGQTVSATLCPPPLKWIDFKPRNRHQWRWFDGRECQIVSKNWFTTAQLFVNDEVAYELPTNSPAMGMKRFYQRWRRADDGTEVLVVEVLNHTHCLYDTYRFLRPRGLCVGTFELIDLYRLKSGQVAPMPIQSFSGTPGELLLIFAFIVAVDNYCND
jgi:hypothetical protein